MRAWLTGSLLPPHLLSLSAGQERALAPGRHARPRSSVQGADRAQGGRTRTERGDEGAGGREVDTSMMGQARREGEGGSRGHSVMFDRWKEEVLWIIGGVSKGVRWHENHGRRNVDGADVFFAVTPPSFRVYSTRTRPYTRPLCTATRRRAGC